MWFYYGVLGMVSLGALAVVAVNYQGLSMLYAYHYTQEKSVARSLQKTVSTVAWMVYLVAYQKIAKNVERKGKNEYDVHYMLGNRLYKVRVHTRKGPQSKQVLQVIDECDNDVTAVVVPYLGPLEDWHGKTYAPTGLGYESLTFNMASGKTLCFHKDQAMRFMAVS
jgi:hypothetical protein